MAALVAAAHLAKNLCTHIRSLAAEAGPIHFSLQRPHVTGDFLERRLYRLICDAGIDGEEVTIQISLCRSPKRALVEMLVPSSLLVMAGKFPLVEAARTSNGTVASPAGASSDICERGGWKASASRFGSWPASDVLSLPRVFTS